MKSALVALAVILSGLASAQTTVHYPVPTSVVVNAPCANGGKGQTMTLTANWETMYSTKTVNGKQNGFFLYAGKTLAGKGTQNNHWYYADGSVNEEFTGFNPTTGDGTFVVTTSLQIVSTVGTQETERFLYHLKQQFTVSNNGNTLTTQPDELVCK